MMTLSRIWSHIEYPNDFTLFLELLIVIIIIKIINYDDLFFLITQMLQIHYFIDNFNDVHEVEFKKII